jgi:peptide/nickel transport system substrate-binding protein
MSGEVVMRLIVAALLSLTVTTLAAGEALAQKSRDTLRFASRNLVTAPDPYYNNFREAIFFTGQLAWDTLVYRDPATGNYLPLLATSWNWIDNKTIDFELRPGVKFHDGRPFSADDVVYTVNYVVDPDKKVFVPSNVNFMERAEKLGPLSVRLHLKAPFAPLLEYLSGPIAIMPKDFYAPGNVAGPALVGTGPYKITKWVSGQVMELELNPGYFAGSPKGRPSIGHIQYKMVPEVATQIAELIAGNVEWIYAVPADQATKLAGLKGLTVVPEETMRISYLQMDAAGRSGKNPFQDIRVRQALHHAIDREAIAKNLIGRGSRVIHAVCYPVQFGCSEDVVRYAYDPARAKALLAEAGYPNGFSIDLYAYRERRWVEAIMGYLASVGIQAKLQFLQFAAMRDKWYAGQLQIFDASWGSYSVNDVSALVNAFFLHTPEDTTRDDQVRDWVQQAAGSVDPAERKELYKKALQRIAAQAYWVPLYVNPSTYAYTSDLEIAAFPDENPRFFLAKWK